MITRTRPIDLETQEGALPIRCFADERLLPDQDARRQLARLAALPGLRQYVAVLPDVHYKSRNATPTGTVVVSENLIVPRAIDDGINCGMRSMATSIPANELTPRILDELFTSLVASIPLKEHQQPLITEEQCEQVLTRGLEALVEPLGLPPDELAGTENGGRMLPHLESRAIAAVLPEKALRKERGSIGTIGAGNHFLELQEIVELTDPLAARRLGLEQGSVMFMMHTDSRRLGKKILRPMRQEAEEACRTEASGDLWTIPVESEIGQRYLCAMTAAMHAGFANRAAVTHILRRTLRDVLGDSSIDVRLICDSGHETIQRERHDGSDLWVHRHGASRGLPPVEGDGIGQPVPIAGCLGTESYLGTAQPEIARSFCSAPHGAGRVMAKAQAAEVFDPVEVETDVASRGSRLYRYHSDNIAGQAPASFKDVGRVVDVMARLDMIRPVARLRPVAVLKG